MSAPKIITRKTTINPQFALNDYAWYFEDNVPKRSRVQAISIHIEGECKTVDGIPQVVGPYPARIMITLMNGSSYRQEYLAKSGPDLLCRIQEKINDTIQAQSP